MRQQNGTFSPGHSGNPSGRPAVIRELQALARSHTPDAIATLVEIMKSNSSAAAARVAAAVALLDRAYGKPSTAVYVEAVATLNSPEERQTLLESLATALEGAARVHDA